ncbi:hypothetical protein IHO40_01365 [Wolbachia endosymbiont of Mansonella ozzardi]|uniref:hypothetical protein n=1 Tax=Wolbachia endosymbiont of Mansonella ozzardi TaxID=137464 RepID=UPI001CE06043|nr:hypothetical protein [Wolbachia endosymbiont of Mansonella ozzardi]MCA4774811.1 hypothetical protein [Wolbachia endosymbiont of Mansonella ozzardi]
MHFRAEQLVVIKEWRLREVNLLNKEQRLENKISLEKEAGEAASRQVERLIVNYMN